MRIHTVPPHHRSTEDPPRLVPRRAPVPSARFISMPARVPSIKGGASAPVGAPALTLKKHVATLLERASDVVSRLTLRSRTTSPALHFALRLPLLAPKSQTPRKDVGPTIGRGVPRPRQTAR